MCKLRGYKIDFVPPFKAYIEYKTLKYIFKKGVQTNLMLYFKTNTNKEAHICFCSDDFKWAICDTLVYIIMMQ
jgi:hypothetical protein